MILDQIAHRASYRDMHELTLALDYMAGVAADAMPETTVQLAGDDVFVNPVRFTTKPDEDCLYEAHELYADIHYILEGCEKIIVSDRAQVTEVTTYSADRDIGFYRCAEGVVCVLHPGQFLVCFPQDVHRVAMQVEGPTAVKKLVGKFKVK